MHRKFSSTSTERSLPVNDAAMKAPSHVVFSNVLSSDIPSFSQQINQSTAKISKVNRSGCSGFESELCSHCLELMDIIESNNNIIRHLRSQLHLPENQTSNRPANTLCNFQPTNSDEEPTIESSSRLNIRDKDIFKEDETESYFQFENEDENIFEEDETESNFHFENDYDQAYQGFIRAQLSTFDAVE